MITLWFARRHGPASAEQTEADRRGAAADHARFTVRLLVDDAEVPRLADEAFTSITAIAAGRADGARGREAAGRYVR